MVKNTLARRAIKGTAFEGLEKHFAGTTAIAVSGGDPVALAKVLTTFAGFGTSGIAWFGVGTALVWAAVAVALARRSASEGAPAGGRDAAVAAAR